MKMKWLIAISLSVLFCACSKEHTPTKAPVAAEKFPVRMSVAEFIKKVQPLSLVNGRTSAAFARDSALAAKVSDIYYYIFNSSGELITLKHQTLADPNFGSMTDSLPAGTYKVNIAASTDSLIFGSSPLAAIRPVHYEGSDAIIDKAWPDIFFKSSTITVSSNESSNNFPMVLNRMGSQLEVNITDAPAIGDSNITVNVVGECFVFNLYDGSKSTSFRLPIPRKSPSVYSELVLQTDTDMTLNISYPDKLTKVIVTKEIHVQLSQNTKTILTGSLYSPSPGNTKNSGFSVQIQDAWNPSEIINF